MSAFYISNLTPSLSPPVPHFTCPANSGPRPGARGNPANPSICARPENRKEKAEKAEEVEEEEGEETSVWEKVSVRRWVVWGQARSVETVGVILRVQQEQIILASCHIFYGEARRYM